MSFYSLKVADVAAETDQAKTITFAVPPELSETFRWKAGQHLTLRVDVDGTPVRRAYTISASPYSGQSIGITVKRVENGRFSNQINDQIKPGDILEVMPPFGHFCLESDQQQQRSHYFFGAGSGITPLYAMLHSVLLAEPDSLVYLLYGNRDADSIIFRQALEILQQHYGDRLVVAHVLSSSKHLSSASSECTVWRQGHIDNSAVQAFISRYPPKTTDARYYVCGPGDMNLTVKNALNGMAIGHHQIHSESYAGEGAEIDDDRAVVHLEAEAILSLNGEQHIVGIAEGQTVLEAALDAGLDPDYVCQSGVCGACQAQLIAGTVHMHTHAALEQSDLDRGLILTCQARPTSDTISVEWQD